ncbi:HAD family hydrolase [Gallionella capsiferriformans]|uniref:Phosphoglycolate phosphatase n=1 Tax=Gallionella capsiferriformans (strain ES-2) TaxID=395494 RepID=D9SFN2_GALCS|nr:HAD-IA family hydrolase [Gallionella capsiferriformans]ADL55329.1 phosphoglycolate phosphatase [Gallionella capsiferriformans ES-2]
MIDQDFGFRTEDWEAATVKAVLFDLDGTFADTAPDLAAALNQVRFTRNLTPLPLEVLRPQASHGSAGLLKVGMNVTPDSPDFIELRDIFLNHYANNICVHTALFEGMSDLINELELRSLPWGIVTNKPHIYTLPLMQALGYADRAACLISGDTCSNAKPHPDPMNKACEIINIAPENCLYLGDDVRDMQAANAVNMRGVIARYGYISADAKLENWAAHAMIDTPLELLKLIPL